MINYPLQDFISFPVPGRDNRVDTPNYEYINMWEKWRLPYTLWGGTDRMWKAGKYYLPQEEGEDNKAYKARLHKTFLYNAYRRSIQSLAGQPFIKPVAVHNLPPELEYLLDDADSMGNSLTEVAHGLLVDGLHYGKYHAIVDYPSVDGDITLSDQRSLNIRPYFNTVSPLNLIGWESDRVGGLNILTNVRVKETSVESSGEYTDILVTRVRVYGSSKVEIHTLRGRNDSDFEMEEADNTLGFIPLVTGYIEKTGFMTARPPLEDLAWLNLRHWISTSEQNVILHATRVPIFFARGFAEGELQSVSLGPYRGISTTNENAEISYIETQNMSISAGEKDLERIELQMERMGSDILTQKSVARQTATARQIDKSESLSVMQMGVRELEHSLEKMFEIAGEWMGVDASEVKVTIGDDLAINANEANPIDELLKLGLDDEDLLFEIKRRGTVSGNVERINIQREPDPFDDQTPPDDEEDESENQ